MIGRIHGQLLDVDDAQILVDVGGVGYEVEITQSARARLGAVGDAVTLATHFVVREDAQLLYGFESVAERDLFRTLIRISGVGPRVALGLLSWTSASELVQLVFRQDVAGLTRAPGIGRKTAERLVVELKDRVAHLAVAPADPVPETPPALSETLQEAERALIALGYRPQEAARVLGTVFDAELGVEELIKRALQSVARSQEASAWTQSSVSKTSSVRR